MEPTKNLKSYKEDLPFQHLFHIHPQLFMVMFLSSLSKLNTERGSLTHFRTLHKDLPFVVLFHNTLC